MQRRSVMKSITTHLIFMSATLKATHIEDGFAEWSPVTVRVAERRYSLTRSFCDVPVGMEPGYAARFLSQRWSTLETGVIHMHT